MPKANSRRYSNLLWCMNETRHICIWFYFRTQGTSLVQDLTKGPATEQPNQQQSKSKDNAMCLESSVFSRGSNPQRRTGSWQFERVLQCPWLVRTSPSGTVLVLTHWGKHGEVTNRSLKMYSCEKKGHGSETVPRARRIRLSHLRTSTDWRETHWTQRNAQCVWYIFFELVTFDERLTILISSLGSVQNTNWNPLVLRSLSTQKYYQRAWTGFSHSKKRFLWNHTKTFWGLWSRKVLCDWTRIPILIPQCKHKRKWEVLGPQTCGIRTCVLLSMLAALQAAHNFRVSWVIFHSEFNALPTGAFPNLRWTCLRTYQEVPTDSLGFPDIGTQYKLS